MAVDGSAHSVLLLTDATRPRPLPLPVAQRIELSRPSASRLTLRVAKDKFGRVSSPRPIAWVRREPGSEPELPPSNVRRLA
jgi:recombination protein RecA